MLSINKATMLLKVRNFFNITKQSWKTILHARMFGGQQLSLTMQFEKLKPHNFELRVSKCKNSAFISWQAINILNYLLDPAHAYCPLPDCPYCAGLVASK